MRWLLLALALGVGVAQSEVRPPENTNKEKPQVPKGAKSPQIHKQGTAGNPLVVRRLDAEETPERRAQTSAEREEKAANERSMVFWTWILALLTGALAIVAVVQVAMFWKQLGLMRKELLSTHHPKIVLRDAYVIDRVAGKKITVRYTLANIGGATGRITRSALSVQVVNTEGMKDLLGDFFLVPRNDTFADDFEAGTHFTSEKSSTSDVWPDKFSDSNPWCFPEGKNLFFCGEIVYSDAAGITRRTSFYRPYDPIANRFYRSNAHAMQGIDYEED